MISKLLYYNNDVLPNNLCKSLISDAIRLYCYEKGKKVQIIDSEAKMGIEELEERNVKCGLYSFPTIKPIDSDLIRMLADYCMLMLI